MRLHSGHGPPSVGFITTLANTVELAPARAEHLAASTADPFEGTTALGIEEVVLGGVRII